MRKVRAGESVKCRILLYTKNYLLHAKSAEFCILILYKSHSAGKGQAPRCGKTNDFERPQGANTPKTPPNTPEYHPKTPANTPKHTMNTPAGIHTRSPAGALDFHQNLVKTMIPTFFHRTPGGDLRLTYGGLLDAADKWGAETTDSNFFSQPGVVRLRRNVWNRLQIFGECVSNIQNPNKTTILFS